MSARDELRRYLLGSSSEDEREKFEQDLLTEEGFYEELLVIEEELIDEYVTGELPEAQEASLLQYLNNIPDYEKRLEFARALREHRMDSHWGLVTSTAGAKFPVWASWVVAAAVLVIAIGGPWSLGTISSLRQQIDSSGPRSFALTAGTLRSGGTTPVLQMSSNTALVEFQLDLGFDDYESYRAVFYDAAASELMSLSQLTTRLDGEQILVTFHVASAQLTKGDYYVSLLGVTETDLVEPIARYDFRVIEE